MKTGKRYFVTGASGFIGSHLAAALAEVGHTVYLLIRPSKGLSAGDRWENLAEWLGLTPGARERISVFEGDLDSPDLNLMPEDANFLTEHTDEIVHAAASTSFAKNKRDEAIRTNVHGLRNLTSFMTGGSLHHIHYVSTAYVAHRTQEPCQEILYNSVEFCNPYEESKQQAEELIHNFCKEKDVGLSIYRPSIVYGNSETGRTFRFNALYHPLRSVAYLSDLFRTDIVENSGIHAQELGISLNPEDQVLHMPVRFRTKKDSGLNLIPIDYCVGAIMELMKTPGTEGIFNIVNKQTTTMHDLVSFAGKLFRISGLHVEANSKTPESPTRPLDHLFQRYIEPFQPYIEDTRLFDDRRAAQFLIPQGVLCPVFSNSIFDLCLTFALKSNWGKSSC